MNTDAERIRLEIVAKRKAEEFAVIERHQMLLVRRVIWRTCLNCINFTEITDGTTGKKFKRCGLWDAVPPPEVIVHGCKDWEDDIPF